MTESKPVKHGTQSVVLVDTPGFDDTLESDMVILARIAAYLERVSVLILHSLMCRTQLTSLPFRYREGKKLHGIIYMYRISDRRITGTSRKSLNIVKMLCGDDSIVNVVIATSMWNHVDEATGNSREETGQAMRCSSLWSGKESKCSAIQTQRHDPPLLPALIR